MIRILVAEDEEKLRKLICGYLKKEGFEVKEAKDGQEALDALEEEMFSLALLDIMMPKIDGYEVASRIREVSDLPIVMLTARNTEFDELRGFERGADEYIAKPFSPKILITRIKSVLKRAGSLHERELDLGNIKIAYPEHAIYEEGKPLRLMPREYDLFCYLIENRNQVLSREQILEAVWGADYEGYDRTIDTHIKCLRLKSTAAQKQIKTIRKCGYMFEDKQD